jgi:NADH-quinone oxidoreductase subunit J
MLDPVFLITSLVAVGSAIAAVTRRNPVYAAVWLLISFLSVAVVMLQLSAPFLAGIHVLVYTGAILMLFVFVIMLLNLKEDELGEEYGARVWAGVSAMALGLFALMAWPILADPVLAAPLNPVGPDFGGVEQVGLLLFNVYGLPFELVSLLILVAMFGAMTLAKKHLWA